KLGPHIRPASTADGDCTTPWTPTGDPKLVPPCGALQRPGYLSVRGMTMDRFATMLTTLLRIPVVVNGTGLEGIFNFDLEWTPEQMAQSSAVGESSEALA